MEETTSHKNSAINWAERRPKASPKKAPTQKTMAELVNTKTANQLEGFTADDVDYLADNEYNRYASNSKRIGHAVISHDEEGNLIAQQYDIPMGHLEKTPKTTKLTQFQEIIRNDERRYQAKDAEGKMFYSKRSLQALINNNADPVEIAYFSEAEEQEYEPEWGSNHVPAIFRDDTLLSELPKKMKGGHKMIVDTQAVHYRELNRDRGISQNQVMGIAAETTESEQLTTPQKSNAQNNKTRSTSPQKKSISATTIYKEYFDQWKNQLTPEIGNIMQRAFEANLHLAPENQYRPEWLHAYAYSFTPENEEAQLANNLGSAGKYINTEMMVLERVAKWFAMNQTNTHISIVSAFEMLGDSDIIKSIHYELSLQLLDKSIQLILDLEAFRENPTFRKASDLLQTTGIGYAILHAQPPAISSEKITMGPSQEEASIKTAINEASEDSFPSIEETILKTLAEKMENESDTPSEQPNKKFKTEGNLSRWQLNNNFFKLPTNMHLKPSIATIADFETSGLNSIKDEIIEIGLITFSFSTDKGVWEVIGHYHALNTPKNPISALITKLTHIDNAMLAGQTIDWNTVIQFLQRSDFILCHNSQFDRKFFELQTPRNVQEIVRTKPFGCTYKDIDWKKRGYDNAKLSYLNQQMGFPFVGHRAIKDCWATLNLLLQDPEALSELVINMKKETMLGAINAPYGKKDLLREWGYQWSSGNGTRLPKGWWVSIPNEYVATEKAWLNQEIFTKQKGRIEEHDASLDRYAPRMLG